MLSKTGLKNHIKQNTLSSLVAGKSVRIATCLFFTVLCGSKQTWKYLEGTFQDSSLHACDELPCSLIISDMPDFLKWTYPWYLLWILTFSLLIGHLWFEAWVKWRPKVPINFWNYPTKISAVIRYNQELLYELIHRQPKWSFFTLRSRSFFSKVNDNNTFYLLRLY